MNSPDTAPRDVLILGRFAGVQTLMPTVWDHHCALWVVPQLEQEVYASSGKATRFFQDAHFYDGRLIGWLPLPTLDHLETEA